MLAAQPAEREAKHPHARSIEPLRIVDRNDRGALLGMHSKHGEDGEADGSLVGRSLAGEEKRGLERFTLQQRKPRKQWSARREQIAETDIGERLLLLGGPAAQNDASPPFRLSEPLLPQRRLADARLAGDHERRKALPGAGKE